MERPDRRWLGEAAILLVLVLVALVPRVVAVGALTNPDELHWIERSVSFYDALERRDWAATLEAFHPGVVPAWGFGAVLCARYGLTQLRAWQAADALPMADLARTAALFPVALSVFTVLAVYVLVRRLFGREAALYGALLLAVEPYYLAFTHAIHLDLTQASLMIVAALLWLNYLQRPRRWYFLAGSGLVSGLALLTRSGSLFMIPFSLLAVGGYFLADNLTGPGLALHQDWRRWAGRVALAWLAWLGVLLLTAFSLWPALWVQPLAALHKLALGVLRSVENPHASPAFFLGRIITDDPGLLYYLLILLFRLRPATLLLALLSPLLLGLAWRRLPVSRRVAWVLLLAYPLFYLAQMSLAPHKLERYLVPLVPALCLLAGLGLSVATSGLATRLPARFSALPRETLRTGLVAGAIVALALPWLRLAPYYSTYYDPLVGGGRRAAELFIVGGGEGLDQAAAYLNDKPGIEDQWVLSQYPQILRYYFRGHCQTPTWGSWAGLPVGAQYVIITQGQAQRGLYGPTLDVFLPRQPEYTVRLNGIDYAWIYQVPREELDSPPPIQHPLDWNYEHRVHLAGYDAAQAGGELHLTLYWQLIASIPQQVEVTLRLVDGAGRLVAEQSEPPWSGDVAVLSWPGGLLVRDQHVLTLPIDLPAGDYDLRVSLTEWDDQGQARSLKLEGEAGTEAVLGSVPLAAP